MMRYASIIIMSFLLLSGCATTYESYASKKCGYIQRDLVRGKDEEREVLFKLNEESCEWEPTGVAITKLGWKETLKKSDQTVRCKNKSIATKGPVVSCFEKDGVVLPTRKCPPGTFAKDCFVIRDHFLGCGDGPIKCFLTIVGVRLLVILFPTSEGNE